MSDISIMMVTYNRLNLTKQTFESISKLKDRYNLIIVDNNSTDGTVDYLKEFKGFGNTVSLKVIYNSENKGIAIGRNQALKAANELNTKWFCTMDNDVQAPDYFLEECVDIMVKNPKYGAIGVNLEGIDYPFVTENGKTFQYKPAGNLGSGIMLMSHALHKMLGYFNTEYNKYGLEDADLGMRARVAGFKLGYIKENGIHLGVDEHDTGEYRAWKTKEHDSKLSLFNQNCRAYHQRTKPIYIPYKDSK